MKKLILLTILLLNSFAIAQWLPLNVKLSGFPFFNGGMYTDSRIAFLSGGTNVFFKSFDQGKTWTFEALPAGARPFSFAVSAGGHMMGVESNISGYWFSDNLAGYWRFIQGMSVSEAVSDIEGSRQNIFFVSLEKSIYRKTGAANWLTKCNLQLVGTETIKKIEAFKDTGELFAATSAGRVYKSNDDGLSFFESVNINADITLMETYATNNIAFTTTRNSQQMLYISSDRGLTWDSIALSVPLAEFQMNSVLKGIARSSSNDLYRTTDGMRTWILCPGLKVIKIGVTKDENGIAMTPDYLIYTTSNAGENWEIGSELNTFGIRGIEVLPDNSAYAITVEGALYRSGNYGMTWNRIHDSLPATITRLDRESDTTLLAYSTSGTVLRYSSLTGLITDISNLFPVFDQPLYKYGNTLFALKNKQMLHFSENSGLTWTNRPIPDSAVVNFFFAADSFFYIASNDGSFFESSDKGVTWSKKRLSYVTGDKILFIYRNGLRLWASSTQSKMYFSKDGGVIWTPVDFKNTYRAFYCHKNLWLMQVNSGETYQTNDEGRTWQRTVHFPAELTMATVKVNTRGFGLMVDANGKMYRMHNGGLPVELTSFNAEVVSQGIILTWETASETNNHGFYLQRRNSGIWSDIAFIPGKGTSLERSNYSFMDELKPQKGDSNYYRLKQVDFSGEFSFSNQVAVGFTPYTLELDQNYPNPFSVGGEDHDSKTQIRFRLPEDGNTSLKVFDARGREVDELFTGYLPAGEHVYTFPANGTSHASGVYFYELRFNGNVKRGKMMLLR